MTNVLMAGKDKEYPAVPATGNLKSKLPFIFGGTSMTAVGSTLNPLTIDKLPSRAALISSSPQR